MNTSAFEQIFGGFIAAHQRLQDAVSGDAAHHHHRDRASVLATAILQIVMEALRAWIYREDVDLAAARAEIEALLRDEIADIERQIAGDREPHAEEIPAEAGSGRTLPATLGAQEAPQNERKR